MPMMSVSKLLNTTVSAQLNSNEMVPPDCVRCNRAQVAFRWTFGSKDFAKAKSGMIPSAIKESRFDSGKKDEIATMHAGTILECQWP